MTMTALQPGAPSPGFARPPEGARQSLGAARRLLTPLRSIALLASGLLCTLAHGQTAQELQTRALAATCANCHGTDGRAVSGAGNARLAGQSSEVIIAQMQAFRSGARPATVMHQLAKGYSDAQIRDLAAYFAAQR